MRTVSLGESLTPELLLAAARGEELRLRLGREALGRVEAARRAVAGIAAGERAVYGVNTGFGALAKERIGPGDVGTLQRHLLLSHAVGTGPDLPAEEKRLSLLLRIHSMCRGASGVRPELLRWLIRLFESGWLPRVPEQGSVGACGDLAPLAHLALPVIGAGEMVSPEGRVMSAKRALPKIGLEPMELAAKEGLALINGVQVSNAIGLVAWARMRNLSVVADVVAALSVEALMGSHLLLKGSQVVKSHIGCGRVQDPYSFRCTPQVHGAAKDGLRHLEEALLIEADSATDNPLVFPERGDTISAGNFHGQPIALPLDHGALVVSAWANISERRISTLLHPAMNNMLPAFLTPAPGLNSGLMIPQVVAAALCSENKVLAHPASADTIPTSADQEDHVSMANHAARKLRQAVTNAERVLAIELYTAAQAREFHRQVKAGAGAQSAYLLVRRHLPPLEQDRYLGPELDRVHELVASGEVRAAAERAVGRELRA
jgi:histidine ammonia-lyase